MLFDQLPDPRDFNEEAGALIPERSTAVTVQTADALARRPSSNHYEAGRGELSSPFLNILLRDGLNIRVMQDPWIVGFHHPSSGLMLFY